MRQLLLVFLQIKTSYFFHIFEKKLPSKAIGCRHLIMSKIVDFSKYWSWFNVFKNNKWLYCGQLFEEKINSVNDIGTHVIIFQSINLPSPFFSSLLFFWLRTTSSYCCDGHRWDMIDTKRRLCFISPFCFFLSRSTFDLAVVQYKWPIVQPFKKYTHTDNNKRRIMF